MGHGLLDLPDVGAVPVECAVQSGPLLRAPDYWLVNNVQCVLERGPLPRQTEGLCQFGRGTGTEDVDDGKEKKQHEKGHSSAWPGLRGLRMPGVALTGGDTVHDGRLRPGVALGERGI